VEGAIMSESFLKIILNRLNYKDTVMNGRLSIRSRILLSFIVAILLMSILNFSLLLSSLKYNEQYDTIVSNITTANKINGIVKTRIDSQMWDIVAGKVKFEDGKQYEIIDEINSNIRGIIKNVRSAENRTRLDVTLRTIQTLTRYVDQIGTQIKEKRPVDENEKTLEEIRGVSSLVEDNIQEFILFEVKGTEDIKLEIQKNVRRWVLTNIIVLSSLLIFSMLVAWIISGSISNPIRELYKMTKSISEGNLDVRVENRNVDEIAALGKSFNIMTEKIKKLLENSVEEQKNLKKTELKLLQAQINPHFLYNTLDTIVWMAEGNKSEEVIEIVQALSNFFRITLSKGNDLITIREEIEHIRSYLIIQKIRYRDIMQYDIEINSELNEYRILKLTLQPLVENALYHGIKNKREGGTIKIRGVMGNENNIVFTVEDDGVGISEQQLEKIQTELSNDSSVVVIKENGFGLNNVHKRLKLNYGTQYGLKIKSEFKKNTLVSVTIPIEG
jgi:two-component system sensor histidine kinase YesM